MTVNVDSKTLLLNDHGGDIWLTNELTENQQPTNIYLTSTSVSESVGANAVVGNLSTDDANVGDSHTYTPVSPVPATSV